MQTGTLAYQQNNQTGRSITIKDLVLNQLDAGLLLAIALVAFEIFSFETARYALTDLLGTVSFAGLRWATILAVAFCAIDFAGLLRFFMLQQDDGDRAEAWYWMGAWLLGATLHALLAWWAVSNTLLNSLPAEGLLSAPQLLQVVPAGVAILTWITRILFIGAFAITGGYLFGQVLRQPGMTASANGSRRTKTAVRPSNGAARANFSQPSLRQGKRPTGRSAVVTSNNLQPIWVGV